MLKSLDDIIFLEPEKSIGEGAFSTVHKVKSKIDQKTYALKKIRIDSLCKKDIANLKNEIKFHRSFSHPHIIQFIDVLQVKNTVYILLEFASNESLFFYVNPSTGLPESTALRFFFQTSLAVRYLHRRNILHRDIKPENILMDDAFRPKLADFGWSCPLDEVSLRSTLAGTFEYMPPEIANEEFHGSKADVWSLGVLLFELLHGHAPFKAESLRDIKLEVNTKPVTFKEGLSEDVKRILTRLLCEQKERFDIEELLEDPFMKKKAIEFKSPLNEKEYDVLITNFYYNKGKIKPVEFVEKKKVEEPVMRTIGKDGVMKEIKVPDIPHVHHMDERFFNISRLVKSNTKIVKRRNSAGIVNKLNKDNSDNYYEQFSFARNNFMKIPILEMAIDSRMSIHPSGKIIVLEREIDWLKDFHRIEKRLRLTGKITFVIYFSETMNCFILSSIRYPGEKNMVRKLVNKHYRGKSKKELFELTNFKDFIFCHKLGLYAGARTLKTTILIGDMSLD